MNRLLLVLLFLALAWPSCPVSAGGGESTLVAPEDDLPRATVKDFEIAFTRNGAFVVSKSGRNLFDCGLVYATPDWADWGTQIRRSAHGDVWHLTGEGVRELVTRGTLFNVERKELLKFTQRTTPIPGGLRFAFEITPLSARKVQHLGVVLHFPVATTAGADVAFWPGFSAVTLPNDRQAAVLHVGNGRGAVLRLSGNPVVSIIGPAGAAWHIFDDRTWNMNTFRLLASDAALLKYLGEGKKVLFSFDIMLGGSGSDEVPVGPGKSCVDPYGRLVIRTDGTKILEGGVSVAGEPVQWFAEQTKPAAAGVRPADGRTWKASGLATFADTTIAYDITTKAEAGSALVTYQLRPQADKPLAERVSLTFAFPEALAAGVPETVSSPETLAGPTSGTPADKQFRHTVTVNCGKGRILRLAAGKSWTMSKGPVNGQECFLLTTPLVETQDGLLVGKVQFAMSTAEAKTNENP